MVNALLWLRVDRTGPWTPVCLPWDLMALGINQCWGVRMSHPTGLTMAVASVPFSLPLSPFVWKLFLFWGRETGHVPELPILPAQLRLEQWP